MSILTARGQEKLIVPLKGYTADQSTDPLDYITGQNLGGQRRGLDVVNSGVTSLSTANLVEIGSTQRVIKKTAHGARRNDVIQFTSGANIGILIQILSCPDANTLILAANPEQTTAIGDSFDIKRFIIPKYGIDGSIVIDTTGLATESKQDDQITLLQSISDQSGPNTAGETRNIDLVGTTASLEVAPANAVGFILQAPDDNADKIRYRIGGTASDVAGVLMEQGRDTVLIPCIADISICAIASTGANKYEITWFIK